jgi:hypothetical protein
VSSAGRGSSAFPKVRVRGTNYGAALLTDQGSHRCEHVVLTGSHPLDRVGRLARDSLSGVGGMRGARCADCINELRSSCAERKANGSGDCS